jgi:amino acid transporter
MSREHALPRPLARLSGRQTPVVAIVFVAALTLALGLPLTYAYGGASTAGYLLATGALAVVLVYLSGNIAVSVLGARRPASFQGLGRVFMPSER